MIIAFDFGKHIAEYATELFSIQTQYPCITLSLNCLWLLDFWSWYFVINIQIMIFVIFLFSSVIFCSYMFFICTQIKQNKDQLCQYYMQGFSWDGREPP